jgi:hypothetical protein
VVRKSKRLPTRYGRDHKRDRVGWQRRIDAGEVVLCRRAPAGACLEDDPRIYVGDEWRLGHPDEEVPDGTSAPEHVRCNQSTALRYAGRGKIPRAKPPGLR